MAGRLGFNRSRGACRINASDIMRHLSVSQNGRITEFKTVLKRGLHKPAFQRIPKIVQSLTIIITEECL